MDVLVQVIFFGGHGVSGSHEFVVKDTVSLEPPAMLSKKNFNKMYAERATTIYLRAGDCY